MTDKKYYAIDELPLMLTAQEAAAVLRIGAGSVYELVRCGKIHSIHIGKKIRIPRQAICTYLDLNT